MKPLRQLAALESQVGELRNLAKVAQGVLDLDNQQALDDTWDRRRRVMQNIERLSLKLAPCLASWDSFLAGLSGDEAALAQKTVDHTAALGREVADLDEKARTVMEGQLKELGRDLEKVATGRKLVRAYRPLPSGPAVPRHLSRRG